MLTVLMATRNGARWLTTVLESYCGLRSPPGGWKLAIVENGSTDGSTTILRSVGSRLPLTGLPESSPGKNAALNTGLGAVEGDLVVLTDDDVFPHPEWLLRLRTAADVQPSRAIFGGAVLPRSEVPPPDWLQAWAPRGAAFSLTTPSTSDRPASAEDIFGPNMAVRAAVLSMGPGSMQV